MGYLMEYFKNRWKEKRWLYVIDWMINLILAAAFIYLSLQVRQLVLTCECPFCSNNTPVTLPNITNSVR
jgi:uncharacterized membrane protein HdeD (DUF308 family)